VLALGWRAQAALGERWRAQATGLRASRTVIGAGRFAGETPVPSPNDLVRVDVRTGRATTLARLRLHDMEISPGGRYLAVLETGEALPVDPDAPFRPSEDQQRRRLRVIDLRTGVSSRPCDGCDILADLLAWSPSGEALLVWSRRDSEAWSEGGLTLIDPRRSEARPVPLHGLNPGLELTAENNLAVRADWLGEHPVVFARTGPDRSDWVRLDPDRPVVLTRDFARPPARISAIDGEALLLVSDGAAWRVDARGRRRRLTGPETVVTAYRSGGPFTPPRLVLNARPARPGSPSGTRAGGSTSQARAGPESGPRTRPSRPGERRRRAPAPRPGSGSSRGSPPSG
jgi:hypothetical protein